MDDQWLRDVLDAEARYRCTTGRTLEQCKRLRWTGKSLDQYEAECGRVRERCIAPEDETRSVFWILWERLVADRL